MDVIATPREAFPEPLPADCPQVDTSVAREPKPRPARPLAPLPETLHPEQRIPIPLVCALVGRRKSKVSAMVAEGTFPKPEHDGPRCARWRVRDVLDWLEVNRERPQMATTTPKPAAAEPTALLAAIAALREVGFNSLQDLALELQAATPHGKASNGPVKVRAAPAAVEAPPKRARGRPRKHPVVEVAGSTT